MDKMNKGKIGQNLWFLVVATCVSSLGGFLFGYDNIVISGAIGYLTQAFKLDATGVGWAAGCALVGCLIGSAGVGALADRIGLKKCLYLSAACFAGSSAGIYFAYSMPEFVAWRILGGMGIGAASIMSPMYIAEIAPARFRGRLVTLYQFGIVIGIFSAVLVNLMIQRSGTEAWNLTVGWKLMFLAGLAPAVLFLAAIYPALESPRWLMKMGRTDEASDVLTKINGREVALAETASIREALVAEEGRFSELFTGSFRRTLILGILLAGLSQTSGITPIFSFLPEIFKAAGAASGDAFLQSVLVSIINIIFTLLALWAIDKAGRRTLLLIGTGCQFLVLCSVGMFYLLSFHPYFVVAGVMAFVAAHAMGNGVVVWVIISEIFPTKVRGRAMSVATTSLWVFAYLGNQVFPLMQKHLGNSGVFFIFGFMALVNFIVGITLVPETKGYSLEEIEKLFLKAK